MFQVVRDFMELGKPEKGTSHGSFAVQSLSWESEASGFQDFTLDPAIPDGYILTPACA